MDHIKRSESTPSISHNVSQRLRVPTWLPCRLQIYFNGHNWLAGALEEQKIHYRLMDNAFVHVSDWTRAQQIADGFQSEQLHRRLDTFAHRFCPIHSSFGVGYHWSLDQCEYATDIVFDMQADLQSLHENLIRHVRQSAKRSRIPTILTPEQMKILLDTLVDLPRTAVLVAASTGLRVGELLGLNWEDVDFETLELRVTRDVVKQRIERCKTEASRKPVPIDAAVAEALWAWRVRCAYNQPGDWVFASPAKKGAQPYWPSSLYRVYLKPVIENDLKITEPVGWPLCGIAWEL